MRGIGGLTTRLDALSFILRLTGLTLTWEPSLALPWLENQNHTPTCKQKKGLPRHISSVLASILLEQDYPNK